MSETTATIRNKSRGRIVFASVSLLAVLVASGLGFAFIEKFRDAADRTH